MDLLPTITPILPVLIRRYPDLQSTSNDRTHGRSMSSRHFVRRIPEIATQSSNQNVAIEAGAWVEAMKKASTWKNTWCAVFRRHPVSLSNCRTQWRFDSHHQSTWISVISTSVTTLSWREVRNNFRKWDSRQTGRKMIRLSGEIDFSLYIPLSDVTKGLKQSWTQRQRS